MARLWTPPSSLYQVTLGNQPAKRQHSSFQKDPLALQLDIFKDEAVLTGLLGTAISCIYIMYHKTNLMRQGLTTLNDGVFNVVSALFLCSTLTFWMTHISAYPGRALLQPVTSILLSSLTMNNSFPLQDKPLIVIADCQLNKRASLLPLGGYRGLLMCGPAVCYNAPVAINKYHCTGRKS